MWKDLTLKEKRDFMKTAIQYGIQDLDEISETYNYYAKGGDTNSNPGPEDPPNESEEFVNDGILEIEEQRRKQKEQQEQNRRIAIDPNAEIYWNDEERQLVEDSQNTLLSNLTAGKFPTDWVQDQLSLTNTLPITSGSFRFPSEEERLEALKNPLYNQYLENIQTGMQNRNIDDLDLRYDVLGLFANDPERAIRLSNMYAKTLNFDLPRQYVAYRDPFFSGASFYSGREDAQFNPKGYIGGLWDYDYNGNITGFVMSPDQQKLYEYMSPEQLYSTYYPFLGDNATLYKLPAPLWNQLINQPLYKSDRDLLNNTFDTTSIRGEMDKYGINLSNDLNDFLAKYTYMMSLPTEPTVYPMPEVPNLVAINEANRSPAPASQTIIPTYTPVPPPTSMAAIEEAFQNNTEEPTKKESKESQLPYIPPIEKYALPGAVGSSAPQLPFELVATLNSLKRRNDEDLIASSISRQGQISTPMTDAIVNRTRKRT